MTVASKNPLGLSFKGNNCKGQKFQGDTIGLITQNYLMVMSDHGHRYVQIRWILLGGIGKAVT